MEANYLSTTRDPRHLGPDWGGGGNERNVVGRIRAKRGLHGAFQFTYRKQVLLEIGRWVKTCSKFRRACCHGDRILTVLKYGG